MHQASSSRIIVPSSLVMQGRCNFQLDFVRGSEAIRYDSRILRTPFCQEPKETTGKLNAGVPITPLERCLALGSDQASEIILPR